MPPTMGLEPGLQVLALQPQRSRTHYWPVVLALQQPQQPVQRYSPAWAAAESQTELHP